MKKYICGNWKMNLGPSESEELFKEIRTDEAVDVLIACPYTSLDRLSKLCSNIKIAAQNVSEYPDGAKTGEISTTMLKSMGVENVILGHSERRTEFFETDEIVNKKLKRAVSEGISVILCIGESKEINSSGKEFEFLKSQLKNSIGDVRDFEKITIAYEPIWAIGTGEVCDSDKAQQICKFIREELKNMGCDEIRILYGGSVKPENAGDILSQSDIDGVLVGGASLKSEDFNKIIESGARI